MAGSTLGKARTAPATSGTSRERREQASGGALRPATGQVGAAMTAAAAGIELVAGVTDAVTRRASAPNQRLQRRARPTDAPLTLRV